MNWDQFDRDRPAYIINKMGIPKTWWEIYRLFPWSEPNNPSDQVVDILTYGSWRLIHGQLRGYLNKLWEIEAMSELFGIPPDEIKRYLIDPENKDKKHLLSVLAYYREIITGSNKVKLDIGIDIEWNLTNYVHKDDVIKWIDILKYLVSLWNDEKSTMKLCAEHFSISARKISFYFKAAIHYLQKNQISLPNALLSITES
jgi:hypothetical protein